MNVQEWCGCCKRWRNIRGRWMHLRNEQSVSLERWHDQSWRENWNMWSRFHLFRGMLSPLLSQSWLWHCSSAMFLNRDIPKRDLGSTCGINKVGVIWKIRWEGRRHLEIWFDVFLPTRCSYLFLPQGSLWYCWSAMFLDRDLPKRYLGHTFGRHKM